MYRSLYILLILVLLSARALAQQDSVSVPVSARLLARASVVGGVSNVMSNWDHITDGGFNFGKFGEYFGAGAAGGEASLYLGPEAGFAIAGGLNLAIDNQYGYANGWSWSSFINGGMSALGAGEAGLGAVDEEALSAVEKATYEKAETRVAGLLGNTAFAKNIFKTKIGKSEFEIGEYYKDAYNAGRDATLNLFKDPEGDHSFHNIAKNLGLAVAANSVNKLAASGIKNSIQRDIAGKYAETMTFEGLKNATARKSENPDLGDFYGSAASTLISSLAGRLFRHSLPQANWGVTPQSPGGELYWVLQSNGFIK